MGETLGLFFLSRIFENWKLVCRGMSAYTYMIQENQERLLLLNISYCTPGKLVWCKTVFIATRFGRAATQCSLHELLSCRSDTACLYPQGRTLDCEQRAVTTLISATRQFCLQGRPHSSYFFTAPKLSIQSPARPPA